MSIYVLRSARPSAARPKPRTIATTIECDHCRRPYAAGPDMWSCSRGYFAGLCEGLKQPHIHAACQGCHYEVTVRLEPRGAA